MLSTAEDLAAGNTRYYGLYEGIVVDNADPAGLHQVRVSIPGLIDKSRWARPKTAGGGSSKRGGHVAPKIGATVYVQFLAGDVERPVYEGGSWASATSAGDERTTELGEAGVEAHLVQAIEFDDFRIAVDEREGKRALSILNKSTGDFVTIDVAAGGLHVRMTSAILLECIGAVDIDAAQITLNGRNVLADSKGIG